MLRGANKSPANFKIESLGNKNDVTTCDFEMLLSLSLYIYIYTYIYTHKHTHIFKAAHAAHGSSQARG